MGNPTDSIDHKVGTEVRIEGRGREVLPVSYAARLKKDP